jgi:hypothetical protein
MEKKLKIIQIKWLYLHLDKYCDFFLFFQHKLTKPVMYIEEYEKQGFSLANIHFNAFFGNLTLPKTF